RASGGWGWRNELACDAPKSRSRVSSRSSCAGFGAITANTAGRRWPRPPPEDYARAKPYRNPPSLGGLARPAKWQRTIFARGCLAWEHQCREEPPVALGARGHRAQEERHARPALHRLANG